MIPNLTVCAIWFHLYKLKNLKNTHGGALFLVKLQVIQIVRNCASTTNMKLHATFFEVQTILVNYYWESFTEGVLIYREKILARVIIFQWITNREYFFKGSNVTPVKVLFIFLKNDQTYDENTARFQSVFSHFSTFCMTGISFLHAFHWFI